MGKKIAKLEKPLTNRIIGHGEEDVDQLLANPLNFRLHPDNQQQALAGSIDDIGFIRSVTVNQRTGRVIDGHLRVTLAARSDVKSLPVEYVDLDEAEEAQALLSLDPISAMAASDKTKLDELMQAVQSDDERVQAMMAEIAEREGVEFDKAEPPDDVAPQIDKADELQAKWNVQDGQLWQLGEHKIICGDCTDGEVVRRLMGGQKAHICWTDPPWNVAYGQSFNNTRTDNPMGWKKRTIANDNLGDKFPEFVDGFVAQIHETLVPGGILYMAMSAQEWGVIMQALAESGFHWSSTIIWAKDSLVVSRKDYHTQYEPIWYGWKDDAARVCVVDDRKQSDLWQIPRPKRSDEHPTMKPVELVERAIRNSSRAGDIVFEPFAGSGTDIIACERSGRECMAIELEPKYVAVAIQRWVDVTGKEPVLISTD